MGISAQQLLQSDPEYLQRQLAQQEMQRLNPTGSAAGALGALLGRGVSNIAGGRGFFDVNDAGLRRVADVQRIMSSTQFDPENPTSYYETITKSLQEAGYGDLAPMAAQEASKYRKIALDEKRVEAALRKEELSQEQETKLRQELNALGPNATEEQVLTVVTKYGSPDKIMAALSAKQSREATREQQRDIAQQRLDIQRQGLALRQDIQATKIAEKTEKQQAAAEGAFNNAGRVIQTVTEAKQLVGPLTAGYGGALAVLPGTDARKLQNKISTIKANLGFDRLQQMRDASPTGGALGQVAVQEINFLQSTVASLDQLESPADITAALNKIEEHYTNWKTALEGKLPVKYQTGGGQAAVPSATMAPLPPGVTVKRKGQ
jgi:hypothetical protein